MKNREGELKLLNYVCYPVTLFGEEAGDGWLTSDICFTSDSTNGEDTINAWPYGVWTIWFPILPIGWSCIGTITFDVCDFGSS